MEKSIADLTSNLETKITEIKENSPKIIEKLINLQAIISNKIDPEDKVQKYSIIIIAIIILLLIAFGIYTIVKRHIIFNKYITCQLCHKEFMNTPVSSIDSKKISKELIEGPTNDKQRAYSIWIYVKDHYHNFDESNQPMKHVFTHGSQDSVYDMDNKSVGLWLHSFKK